MWTWIIYVTLQTQIAEFHVDEGVRGISELAQAKDMDDVRIPPVAQFADCTSLIDDIGHFVFGIGKMQ